MSNETKTHFRKAFDSPYLSSADIVEPTDLTIHHVTLEVDRTKKTKDKFNTAWFAEKDIRPGEPLKPMILNATNSKRMSKLAGSAFIDDWQNIRVTVYVDPNVKFGKEVMEGLRINTMSPLQGKPELTPTAVKAWGKAKDSFRNNGNLIAVLKHAHISAENQMLLMEQVAAEDADEPTVEREEGAE